MKAVGWQVKDAYQAFENYNGKASYDQLQLEPPAPRTAEDGDTDVSSHMSDYDELGYSPISLDEPNGESDNRKLSEVGANWIC